ncbi:hypothetical protein V4D30_01605 [Thermodesulfovibrio sp. 3907-1M]|uniref:Calcineurin-like phosphoesterase domain-containing protein n=1 Tax=Thermodesulfovibrio autotrophicus TaxID=3118333 RepID=A0AAU8GYA4_9BACT
MAIASLPILGKNPDVSVADELNKLRGMIDESLKLDSSTPHLFVSHGTVDKAVVNSGSVLPEFDYTQESLEGLSVKWCLLGHIHRAQKIGSKIFYAGSPIRRQIGEDEPKGFWIHDLKKDSHNFVELPVRHIYQIEVSENNIPELSYNPEDIVRVVVKLKENVNQDELLREVEQRFKGDNVKIQKIVMPTHTVRVAGISKKTTLIEKCETLMKSIGIEMTDSLKNKIKIVEFCDPDEIETIAKSRLIEITKDKQVVI